MPVRILDAKLVNKLAVKLRKNDTTAISKLVSARAARAGISSEAALVLLAKENGIGAGVYQRRLDPAKQAEIRAALPSILAPAVSRSVSNHGGSRSRSVRSTVSKRAAWKAAVEYLIQDSELLGRCGDLLRASGRFDRAVNQATLVLEDRIRNKAQPATKLVGENLVNYAFNEQVARSVLVVQSNDPDDQRGFTQMLRGVVPAFRNRTHHHLTNTFPREEALRVCGFIDVLLRVVDNTTKRQ